MISVESLNQTRFCYSSQAVVFNSDRGRCSYRAAFYIWVYCDVCKCQTSCSCTQFFWALCYYPLSWPAQQLGSPESRFHSPQYGPHIKTCSQPCQNKETIAGLAFKILLWCQMGECLCVSVCVWYTCVWCVAGNPPPISFPYYRALEARLAFEFLTDCMPIANKLSALLL